MIRNILVPLDGSPFGEHALPLALSLAQRAGAALRLVHILQPIAIAIPEFSGYEDSLEPELRLEKQNYLEDVRKRLSEARSTVTMSAEVKEGNIAETIRAASDKGGADLIVMTTHGRGPAARFWLGSIADQLVRESPVPLLLVHPGKSPPRFNNGPVFRRMLLPLDGTPLAEQIIPHAVEVARHMNAECELLRVVQTDVPPDYAFLTRGALITQRVHAMVEQLEAIQKRQREEAEAYLEGVANRIHATQVPAVAKVVLDEQPVKAILHEAEKACDVVALATHGYSGLKRLWLGSVADKVLRGSTVPVLVYRPR